MFGEGLYKSILAGNSVGDAFVDAHHEIKSLGYEVQNPCIEDNHDGVGHIVNAWGQLPSSGDGNDAKNTYLCQGCPPILIHAPQILYTPLKFWVVHDPALITFPISIGVENSTDIAKVICRVIPEDWTPPEPTDNFNNETMVLWDENEMFFQWELADRDRDGNFSGTVEIMSPSRNSDYILNFIVEDVDGRRSQIVSTEVGVNSDGLAPVDIVDPTVVITNPSENAKLTGIVNITVEGDDDQALDKIQIYVDDTIVKEETMPSYYPYPEVIHSLNTSNYSSGLHTIKAVAIDKANNTQEFAIIVQIGEGRIPGFQITIIFGATILGVIIIIITYRRKKKFHLFE
jgi:hypothetical protein